MKRVSRSYRRVSLAKGSLALLVCCAVLWPTWGGRAQTATPAAADAAPSSTAAATTDLVTYGQVQELRDELSFTTRDLAAYGLTTSRAESLLSALLAWYEQNRTVLQDAQREKLRTLRRLQDAVTRVNVGPRDEALIAELPELEADLAAAEQRRRELIENGIVSAAAPHLTADQIGRWRTARANAGAPARYRHVLDLRTEQRQTLVAALARSGNDATAVRAVEQQTLSAQQLEGIAGAESNVRQYLAGVAAAAARVLPRPHELSFKPAPFPQR